LFSLLRLTGGLTGAQNLCNSEKVKKILQEQEGRGGYVAAVCAGPTAFSTHGISKGKQLTSHPCAKDTIVAAGYSYSEARVCKDGTTITSRGPGTCFEFALAIVEAMVDAETAKSVAEPMLCKT